MNTVNSIALVTGSARNMGRAFALALAEKGSDIVVHFNSESSRADAIETVSMIESLGRKALLVQADLTQPTQVEGMFTQIQNTFGRLDIVVNNAGKIVKKAFVEYSLDDFDSLFNINARASFMLLQGAAKMLSDNGRIINIGTSLLAAFTGHYGLYAGSKAPLEHFTRALAKELGGRGITVNMVAPGPINTAFFHGQEDAGTVAYLSAASVLGRLGEIDDIVPVVAFLASPEAKWMTGQTLLVNGGFVTR
ncbi:SDR family oxidoreductase [Pseudoalteromonas xiamenensis]|uniref:SDR family oxidoreductase n=1 Tax=Pseudoalteromonas xiamenensis TaxID=882626 RepID=UPI0035EEA20C